MAMQSLNVPLSRHIYCLFSPQAYNSLSIHIYWLYVERRCHSPDMSIGYAMTNHVTIQAHPWSMQSPSMSLAMHIHWLFTHEACQSPSTFIGYSLGKHVPLHAHSFAIHSQSMPISKHINWLLQLPHMSSLSRHIDWLCSCSTLSWAS